MKLTEKEIQNLEEKIPKLIEASAMQAQTKVLSSGTSVLIVEDGNILELLPDGKKIFVQKIEQRIPVEKGTIFKIK